MKAVLENVEALKGNRSFVAYSFRTPFFEFKWHYHPEYELTLITKGQGKRIVGDHHEHFDVGDLVLLGPHLPHTWFTDSAPQESEAVVIQFSEEFISSFVGMSEFEGIQQLLQDAYRGIFFEATEEIRTFITQLPLKGGVFRITDLIVILQVLALKRRKYLSSELFSVAKNPKTQYRINIVCQYVQDNSHLTITIDEMAAKLHLTKSAFCKFFKRVMKMSFTDYLNEIRIANVCQWLVSSDKTIGTIAHEAGFESLTYFNRVFLKKKAMTPSDFRIKMKGLV
jgi:AraC-like DNA-binding protein